jgi:hypothetical protein
MENMDLFPIFARNHESESAVIKLQTALAIEVLLKLAATWRKRLPKARYAGGVNAIKHTHNDE